MLTPTRVVEITPAEAAHIKQHQLVVASVLNIPTGPGRRRARQNASTRADDPTNAGLRTGKTKPRTCAAFVVTVTMNRVGGRHRIAGRELPSVRSLACGPTSPLRT